MSLKDLGPYRIERSEDYDQCLDGDKSFCEVIRVRGSKAEIPAFIIPSHLFRYSDSELALYLKDKKNLWCTLGKILNEEIDISENEIVLRFPVSKFRDVTGIVPFVRKRGLAEASEEKRKSLSEGMSKVRSVIGKNTQHSLDKIEQTNKNRVLPNPLAENCDLGNQVVHS